MQISRLYDRSPSKLTLGRCLLAKHECTRNVRVVCKLTKELLAENRINLENQSLKLFDDVCEIHIFDRCKE